MLFADCEIGGKMFIGLEVVERNTDTIWVKVPIKRKYGTDKKKIKRHIKKHFVKIYEREVG